MDPADGSLPPSCHFDINKSIEATNFVNCKNFHAKLRSLFVLSIDVIWEDIYRLKNKQPAIFNCPLFLLQSINLRFSIVCYFYFKNR